MCLPAKTAIKKVIKTSCRQSINYSAEQQTTLKKRLLNDCLIFAPFEDEAS
jgi:hypothetical protein